MEILFQFLHCVVLWSLFVVRFMCNQETQFGDNQEHVPDDSDEGHSIPQNHDNDESDANRLPPGLPFNQVVYSTVWHLAFPVPLNSNRLRYQQIV